MPSKSSVSKLAQKIKARENFLRDVVPFVDEITRKVGRVTNTSSGSSWSNTESELKDFGGFTFQTDMGGGMGQNTIKVFFAPAEIFVLEVYWQGYPFEAKRCGVKHFLSDLVWQKALKDVMRRKDVIITEMERIKGAQKTLFSQKQHDEEVQARLHKDAARLKVEL